MHLMTRNGFLADVTDDINWQRIDLAMLSKIDVQLVLSQAAGIAALIVFSTSNVLLNVSGLELVFSRELDFNRELVVAGAGNMLGSLFGGGIAGFPTLSYSALVHRTGSTGAWSTWHWESYWRVHSSLEHRLWCCFRAPSWAAF